MAHPVRFGNKPWPRHSSSSCCPSRLWPTHGCTGDQKAPAQQCDENSFGDKMNDELDNHHEMKVCVCVLHPGVGIACAKNLFLIKVCSYMVYVYMHVYHWIKIDRDAFLRVIH